MNARYVGGPFDGGENPDELIDEIEMRTPAGTSWTTTTAEQRSTGGFLLRNDRLGMPVIPEQERQLFRDDSTG
ncbi:hypothetical protein [Streptomyces sp. NPDC088141]|uniref:hypothetical protein n=1 Tax=unclassified Streptomyces TaxID=2593676 RepID=UPI003435C54B